MMTVRHIERLWDSKSYGKLMRDLWSLVRSREHRLETELSRGIPAAAMALIRLDERQSGVPGNRLLRTPNDQHADGGWGDPMSTALRLRALMWPRERLGDRSWAAISG